MLLNISVETNTCLCVFTHSMGDQLRLKTFDEFITIEMSPSATFIVWHVDDSSGAIVYATLTVHISSRQYTRVTHISTTLKKFQYMIVLIYNVKH